MGGLLAVGMTAAMPAVLAGVILNDVGPDIDRGGYGRIAQAIGTDVRAASFEDAAELWRRSARSANRSEERSVGIAGVRTCRIQCVQVQENIKQITATIISTHN